MLQVSFNKIQKSSILSNSRRLKEIASDLELTSAYLYGHPEEEQKLMTAALDLRIIAEELENME